MKRSDTKDAKDFAELRRQKQMAALNDSSSTEVKTVNLNGITIFQTEVTGNLKTGAKQRFTYLFNAIEGKEEIIFINFWALADNYQKNKEEFVKIIGTMSGLSVQDTKVNSVVLPSPDSPAKSTISPSGATEGAKRLIELKSLLDSGVITAQDYEIKKQQILKSM